MRTLALTSQQLNNKSIIMKKNSKDYIIIIHSFKFDIDNRKNILENTNSNTCSLHKRTTLVCSITPTSISSNTTSSSNSSYR